MVETATVDCECVKLDALMNIPQNYREVSATRQQVVLLVTGRLIEWIQ